MSSLTLCHPAIFQFLIAAIFFVTDGKELKLTQTAEINQLFLIFEPNRSFAWWRHFATMTRILFVFLFIFKFGNPSEICNLHKKGKSWRILVVVVNDVIVQIAYWYKRLNLPWVKSYANEQKCKQWRHDESALQATKAPAGSVHVTNISPTLLIARGTWKSIHRNNNLIILAK